MRRVVVLVVLLLMMLGITALKTDQVRAHDPMTLAAIGFVMLAAFTVSEVGSMLRLPRVTGYILTGVVLGPSAANILSSDVVGEMKMFNTLALGLIATGAGLELDIGQLRRVWRTLFATVGAKVVIAVGLVIGAMIGMQSAFASFDLPSQSYLIGLALVVGALSIGTSPAIVLAVLNESKAKGRLSDLTLGAAVLKDLVVVVVLAIAIAVTRALIEPGAELDASVLVGVAKELGSSVAAGAVLGVLLILYVRYVRAEMLLFVAAMILVVSELGRALHLELLLVFITAGFVVRNFSHHEHELANPLSLVSLPVFVVFFTNAGASVDLLTTWRILPLAIALFAARGLGYFVAGRVGAAVGQESDAIRKHAWMAYLPQAGVTLGLVGLASQQLPELSGPISSTGMAVVALNLLVGPVTLRRALRLSGDIADEPVPQAKPDASVAPAPASEDRVSLEEVPIPDPTEAIGAIENAELRFMAQRTHDRLQQVADEFVREELEPWSEAFRERVFDAMRTDPTLDVERLRTRLEEASSKKAETRGEACRCLYESMHAVIPSLPDQIYVALDDRHRAVQAGDRFGVRLSKRVRGVARAITFRRAPKREVPVRLCARVALEAPLSTACADVLSVWCAFEAVMLDHVSAFASGSDSKVSVQQELQRDSEAWVRHARSLLDASVSEGVRTFAATLSNVGSAALPTASVRYSAVEPAVREAIRRLHEDPTQWEAKLEAARSGPVLAAHLSRVDEATQQAVERHVLARISAVEEMLPLIRGVRDGVVSIRERLDASSMDDTLVAELSSACKEVYPESAELQVERAGHHLRPSASVHYVAVFLRELVSKLPEQITMIEAGVDLKNVRRPRELSIRTVRLRDLATQQMIRSFMPNLDDCVQNASSMLARANPRVREAVGVALTAFEAMEESKDRGNQEIDALLRSLRHTEASVSELEAQIRHTTDELRERALVCVQNSFESMHETATGKAAPGMQSVDGQSVSDRTRHRLDAFAQPIRMRIRALPARIRELVSRMRRSELSRDIQLRYEKPVLDAADIWKYTARWRVPLRLPDTYARLFDGDPVRDHRRFTANQAALDTLLTAEQAWLEGGPGSGLLIGRHGSGRTSLLNLCELEMTAPRLARLRRSRNPRGVGLVAALAAELACRPRMLNLVATLRQTRTLVLIDDLEHWVTPDAVGFRDLEGFLNLVVRTRHETFWLVTVGSEALALLEEAVAVRQAFGHVVTLQPLRIDELMRAVEGRHQLSGCRVTYPMSSMSRLLGRDRRVSDRILFFRSLLSDSEGNLAQAMSLWAHAVSIDGDDCVKVAMPRGLSAGLPFFGQMNVREVAVIVHLLRFGPMNVGEIASGLGVGRDEAERHVGFLRMAGLIEPADATGDELHVPRALRTTVLMGLRDVGAWS